MRYCKFCGKPLSIYNKGKYCFCHTDGMPVYANTSITKCTSYKPTDRKLDHDVNHHNMVSFPGSADYNDKAFSHVVTDVIVHIAGIPVQVPSENVIGF